MVGEGRRDLLLGGDQHLGGGRDQLKQLAEILDRQELGDVRPVVVVGQFGELAVFGCKLGGRRDLDRVKVLQRALAEGAEAAHRLDLVAEQIDADGVVLGRREDVEHPAADRELAAVLHLVDPLVAGRRQVLNRFVEVEQLTLGDREAVRAQARVGDLLGQRHGADHDDRLAVVEQRVKRGDPLADQVRRRRQV